MTSVMPTLHLRSITRDRNKEMAQRLVQIAEQYATIMTERQIRTRLTEAGAGAPPAWSTSNTITFNADSIGDLRSPLEVASMKGLQIHELSHIFFTPRSGSALSQWVLANGYHKAWNILEDQRIETLFVARHPNLTPWFKGVIYRHLLETPQQIQGAYPFIVGREYLSAEVRARVRKAYVAPQHIAELKALVGEYRTMVFVGRIDPDLLQRAQDIIARFHAILTETNALMPEPPTGTGCGGAHSEHDTAGGRPLSAKEQKKAQDKAQSTQNPSDDIDIEDEPADKADEDLTDDDFDFGDPADDFDDIEDEAQDGSGAPDDSTEGDSEDEAGEGAGEADSDADGDAEADGDTEGETDSDAPRGSSAGTGAGDSKLTDLLQGALDNLLDHYADAINEDIERLSGELQLVGDRADVPAPARWQTGSVSVEARQGAHAFGRALEELKSKYDPAWETEVEAGRLNIDRFFNDDCDVTEAFDRWDTGREDAVDIECVILLDKSGSMASQANDAYQSMWGIKSALDTVDASCTVITFNEGAEVLYEATEKAGLNLRNGGVSGGTSPLKALRYAQDVLAYSERAIKIAIFITDGEWSGSDKCDRVIQTLREGGVLTALAYIPYGHAPSVENIQHHNAEVISVISKSEHLFDLGQSLVNIGIGANLARG